MNPLSVVLPLSVDKGRLGFGGGVETFLQTLLREAASYDLSISVLCTGRERSAEGRIEFLPIAAKTDSEFSYSLALRRAIRAKPSLVPSDAVVLANAEHYVWACREAKAPIVFFSHGLISHTLAQRRGPSYAFLYRCLVERRAVRLATRIAAVNEDLKSYYARRYGDVVGRKISVIPIGIPLGQFESRPRQNPYTRLSLRPDLPVILFVGRLSPEKRVGLFLDACREFAASGVPFQAVVVGTGPDERYVKATLEQSSWLHWIPVMSHDAVLDVMSVSSVLAISSEYESGPLVMLEALASGLPVVSTSVGRSRELLRAPYGRLVEPERRSFAHAFASILSQDRSSTRGALLSCRNQIDFTRTMELLVGLLVEAKRG